MVAAIKENQHPPISKKFPGYLKEFLADSLKQVIFKQLGTDTPLLYALPKVRYATDIGPIKILYFYNWLSKLNCKAVFCKETYTVHLLPRQTGKE